MIAHLIPAPLHRLLYRAAYQVRRRWYGWRGGDVSGCTIIARDDQGRFLLVRHSYGPPVWTFPGGGLKSGESPATGAAREFAEELGCEVGNLRNIAVLNESFQGARHIAYVFTAQISTRPVPDRREIVEAAFFAEGNFPANLSRAVERRIALLDQND